MNTRLMRRLWRVAVDALVGNIVSGFALLYPTYELFDHPTVGLEAGLISPDENAIIL